MLAFFLFNRSPYKISILSVFPSRCAPDSYL